MLVLWVPCCRVFMLVLWVPPWLFDRLLHSTPGECYWNPSLNTEFVYFVVILGHHGPFFLMVFCYVKVYWFMMQRRKAANRILPLTIHVSSITPNNDLLAYGRSDNRSALNETTINEAGCSNTNDKHENISTASNERTSAVVAEPSFRHAENVTHSSINGHAVGPIVDARTQHQRLISREARDRRVFRTLTYIIVGYAIMWVPFHVVFDISIIDPELVPEPLIETVFWLTYFNSTINPFLYNFGSSAFRSAFKRILCRKCHGQ